MRLRWIAWAAALAAFCAGPASAGEHRTLYHQGRERSYVVETPADATDGARLPVVFVLHGGGGNAMSAAEISGFTDKARAEGFIAVYPNGTARGLVRHRLTWNAGHCCGYAMRNDIDDIGFIRRLIDILVARDNGDPDRIYVVGMSNGAIMAHRVGIALAGRIAAIAPVAGGLFGDEETPSAPVAALMINGALDRSFPLEGGPPRARFARSWGGAPLMPGAYQGEFWASANGCRPAAEESHPAPYLVLRRYPCPDGRDVVRIVVEDNGHAWPGGVKAGRIGDAPSQNLYATDAIWEFFKTKRR